jgi:peptidoglycan/xylan/chitin deacetylase (PgdA/CDA1 family)
MNSISILMYHSIDSSGSVVSCSRETFTAQMAAISDEDFRGISLQDAVAFRKLNGAWPEKSVVLTFDDGFANVYEHALPVLQQYKFGATVFVISGRMGQLNNWSQPPQKLGEHSLLSWEQARALSSSGIEIGSHTRSHLDLTRCDLGKARQEMTGSRKEIEDKLGQQVSSFAYPYGAINRAVCSLAASEFESSCTTELRRANSDAADCLPRIDAYYLKRSDALQRLLQGQLDRYLLLRRVGRAGRVLVGGH